MSSKLQLLYALLLCGIVNIALGADDCLTCMTNSVHCVDDTSYYVCVDGVKPSGKLITCAKDTFCTNSQDKVCQPESAIIAPVTKPCLRGCGVCPPATATNKRFACVSRTQFDMCNTSNKPTQQISACDDGEVCSADSYQNTGSICVPQCVMDFYNFEITCTSAEVVTTTEAPVPTISPASLEAKCIAALNTSKKAFYLENLDDKTCRTYIVCQEFETDDWDAALLTCKNDGYFNKADSKCQATAPAGCPRTTV